VAAEKLSIGALNTYGLNTIGFNEGRSVITPLIITLSDGNKHRFDAALSCVIDYWRALSLVGPRLVTPGICLQSIELLCLAGYESDLAAQLRG
jgi:hypothetical protein